VLERDIKDHFKPYGELARVQIKRNYAFVEYKTIDDAIDAVKSCDNSRLMGAFPEPSVRYRNPCSTNV
jgi:splicing factor, arginine/serine-rich 4/5/6